MRFFQLIDEVGLTGRWWLKSPQDADGKTVDPEIFRYAKSLDIRPPLKISVRHAGIPLDWTYADFDMPVVSHRTLELLGEFASDIFQWFPASVEGYPGDYAIVNFLEIRKCVDELQSEFVKWTSSDHRADLAGEYRQITKLRINSSLAGNCDAFRLWGWDVALIVSERIQSAFIDRKISGISFVEV